MTFSDLLETNWAIKPGSLRSLLQNSKTAAPEGAAPYTPGQNVTALPEKPGVKIIPISGPILKNPTWYSGGTSFSFIQREFSAAIADPAVRAIVLYVDSPGGEIFLTYETSAMIRAARGKKRIICAAFGDLCSAAYWIGSACGLVVVSPTAETGCLGVQCCAWDFSKAFAQIGIEEISIVSSQTPLKNLDPATDAGRAAVQRTVDSLADIMIHEIAINRGVSDQVVLDRFGRGATFIGVESVRAGMADQVGTLDDILQSL